jgi:hypothetical protein
LKAKNSLTCSSLPELALYRTENAHESSQRTLAAARKWFEIAKSKLSTKMAEVSLSKLTP